MTPDQWITVATNGGIGLVALLVVVYVIVPLFRDESKATRKAISDGATTTKAALDRNTAATTAAGEKTTAAVAGLAERVSRIEGAIDHRPTTGPLPTLANGSRDLAEPLSVVREAVR